MNPPAWRARVAVIAAVIVLLAVGSTVVWLILRAGESVPGPAPDLRPSASASDAGRPEPAQRTLLLQLVDDDQAVGNVLYGTPDADTPGAALVLPADLLIPVPEPIPLGRTAGTADTLDAQQGVAALVGARVDASLELSRLALAGLVDGLGGVSVALTEPLRVRDERGQVVKVVPPGLRTLDGVAAASYAIMREPDEPESARMARVSGVMDQVLGALPGDPDALAQLLLSLGSMAPSTATNEELVDLLIALGQAARDGQLGSEPLRTVTLRSGRAAAMLRPEGPQAVRRLFPDAVLEGTAAAAPVVHLWGAGASAAQLAQSALLLGERGCTPVPTGRAGASATRVLVPDDRPETRALGIQVAQALGLDGSVVVPDDGAALVATVVVLVGPDLPDL